MKIKFCHVEKVRLSDWSAHRLACFLPAEKQMSLHLHSFSALHRGLPIHFVRQREGQRGTLGIQAMWAGVKDIFEQLEGVVSTVVFFNIQRTAVYIFVAMRNVPGEAYEAFLQAAVNLGYHGPWAATLGPIEEISVPNAYFLHEKAFSTGLVSTVLTYKYFHKRGSGAIVERFTVSCHILCTQRNPFLTMFPYCRWMVNGTHVGTMLKMEACMLREEDILVRIDGADEELFHVLQAAFGEFCKLDEDRPSLLSYARNHTMTLTEAQYRDHTDAFL